MNIPYTVEERPDTGLANGKLGIWLFLASEVMLFGALFSCYIILRTGATEWPHGELSVWLGAIAARTRQLPDRADRVPRPVRVQRAGRREGLYAAIRAGARLA